MRSDRSVAGRPFIRRVLSLALCATTAGALVAVGPPAIAGTATIKPQNGSYQGQTAQGKSVSFQVKNRTVKNAQFSLDSGICHSTFYFPAPIDNARINSQGRFTVSTSIATFRGRFVKPNRVRGTATGEFGSCPADSPTKTVTYSAHRK